MKKTRGGARPGAGRPAGGQNASTIEKQALRELLRAKVAAEFEPLIDSQIANAKGLKFLVVRSKTTGKFLRRVGASDPKTHDPDSEIIEIWEKEPSTPAFTDLMNRTVDKPIEPVEVEHTGDLTITWAEQLN